MSGTEVDSSSISLRFSLLMQDDWVPINEAYNSDSDGDRIYNPDDPNAHYNSAELSPTIADAASTIEAGGDGGDGGGLFNDPSVALKSSVETSMFRVLCAETKFYIIKADGGNLCRDLEYGRARRSRRRRSQENGSLSVITQKVHVQVSHHSGTSESSSADMFPDIRMPIYAFEWTEWTLTFPLLTLGTAYEEEAFFDVINQNLKVNGVNIWHQAADNMERDGQMALDRWIDNGRFDTLLKDDGHINILASSIVGLEDVTFPEAIYQYKLTSLAAEGRASNGYTEQLNPAPLHPIRVAGIVLCFGTIIFASLVTYIASVRKRDREAEEALIKTGKGGLTTEEGLDHILDVGKKEAVARTKIDNIQHHSMKNIAASK